MHADSDPARTSLPHQMLRIGQDVHVNVRHVWLPATVTAVAPRHVDVDYRIAPAAPLGSSVAPWTVRDADGIVLKAVHQIVTGDQVVRYDGSILTVAAPPWKGRDHSWQITFTNSGHASIPNGTVLRLIDPTPRVTVNGRRL